VTTTASAPRPVIITEAEFVAFCEFFYRRTGISFRDNKRYYVDKRLIERIEKSGAENFDRYFARLRGAGAAEEFRRLVNLFTVNETYFFREAHQFDCLARSMLPELTAGRRRGSRLRIWSLPCSTGEEPYSIAIYLMEHWPDLEHFELELTGCDIDSNALSAAAEGIYDARAVEKMPAELVRRYFLAAPDGRFQLSAELRGAVRFAEVNASDPASLARFGPFDVIFCRNMLIYFDDRSRRQTVETLYDRMVPGGFICLGHSESMSRISPLFEVRPFPEAIVYQKPGGGP
jgi:chemotaxis protein methyltransferase CheR